MLADSVVSNKHHYEVKNQGCHHNGNRFTPKCYGEITCIRRNYKRYTNQ